jgi:glycosyltransferase involved in cell wall biosynthesis
MRILFVPTYTNDIVRGEVDAASDAVGYGITAAAVLVEQLGVLGHAVDTINIASRDRQRWYAECLEMIASCLRSGPYDVIFCFHSFWPFASEVRRIVDDARRSVPIVAYNHGSHWDPTDAFRQERYPALRWADLGNLLAVDAVLLVSDYMRATLLREVGGASAEAAAQLAARLWVVGLPIDTQLLDACRTEKEQTPTVVFNHSFSEGKRPGAFLEVAEEVLERRPARIVITRGAPVNSPHRACLSRLAKRFGPRITVGETLAIPDYFRALWGSHVQVSTATHESLGIATLEAMYARNCCLLPDLGAYPEVVGPVREALYDPKEERLADRVVGALDDPEGCVALGDRLADRACRYRPVVIAREVEKVLRWVCLGP